MGVIGYFVLLPFRRLVGPAAMQMLGGGERATVLKLPCPKLRNLCNLRIGLLFASFPFANTPKMQRS